MQRPRSLPTGLWLTIVINEHIWILSFQFVSKHPFASILIIPFYTHTPKLSLEMADAVVSAVIDKAVDIGVNMILDQSHKLYWLREDVEWLEQQMRYMLGYLENAEAKKFTNPNVDNLIKNMRDLANDVKDILDIYSSQIESERSDGFLKRMPTCFLPYGWASCALPSKIEKIKRRVEAIDEDRKRYGIDEHVSNVDPRTNKLHTDDPIIVGFDDDIEKLKRKLEEHRFVSIVGMAGLGKTTIAKKVFKGVKDGFDCSASISVSQTPNIKSLMQDIAKQVGVGQTDENLEVNLYSFLQGKRYVVFLDDIWNIEAWDRLKGCFPVESKSRIIITSRNTDVGRYIGEENSLHPLHTFDHSTSWELFSKLIDIPSSVETIGKQIVEKCGGVPLAIVAAVGMLRAKGRSEFSWNTVLYSIGENASDVCNQILSLSYKDLPTFLKPCFLSFGIFPEDYNFFAPDIIGLWMAEKFIPRVRGDREPEDVGAEYISILEARNLIQVDVHEPDGRVRLFRVHDLLHNLCLKVGREINFLRTIDRLEASSAKRVRRLTGDQQSVAGNEKLIHEMTKLRALFHVKFVGETEIKWLNDMLGRFKLLHSLILEFVIEDVCFPSQIKSLSRLNYLQIRSTGSVTIHRSIQSLKNLQTLDVEGCSELKLPIGIWEMKQLRHLLLQNNYEIDSNVMYQQEVQVLLPNLQTLSGIKCSDLKPTWLPKFTNLRKLGLEQVTPEIMEILCGPEPISKKLETLSFWGGTMTRGLSLAKYGRLMELGIFNVKLQMQQPLESQPNLINLTLHMTELNEDPMKILKNLPKLKLLNLFTFSYLGSKMDCSGADNFPQLEILRLSYLPNLEELIEGEEMGMPKLRDLIILGCDRLVRIPERLQQLKSNYWNSVYVN